MSSTDARTRLSVIGKLLVPNGHYTQPHLGRLRLNHLRKKGHDRRPKEVRLPEGWTNSTDAGYVSRPSFENYRALGITEGGAILVVHVSVLLDEFEDHPYMEIDIAKDREDIRPVSKCESDDGDRHYYIREVKIHPMDVSEVVEYLVEMDTR